MTTALPLKEDLSADLTREGGVDDIEKRDVQAAYDGSNVLFRLLRLTTWGPALMNLGYFRFRGPFALLNLFEDLESTQRRLVLKTLSLLKIAPGQQVLDVACGRGMSSFMMHCTEPQASITGMDLLPQNVEVARVLFGQSPGLSYGVGNAMELPFPDGSFDRVQCLEAAFHFPSRARFLQEAFRVLRPGGRLVVVDFVWNNEEERRRRDHPLTRMIRDIWQWDDFFTSADYQQSAVAAGFSNAETLDWSRRVTGPFQATFHWVLALGRRAWGRKLLLRANPMFRHLSPGDWEDLTEIAKAHDHVRDRSKYMAYAYVKA